MYFNCLSCVTRHNLKKKICFEWKDVIMNKISVENALFIKCL